MKIRYLTIILTLGILYSSAIHAQDQKKVRTGLGFTPQSTFVGGMRFEIDKRIGKNQGQWIIFSPQVFALWDRDFNSLWGLGLDVKHRIFLKDGVVNPEGFYFQYGPVFHYYTIDSYRSYTEPYIVDGVEYYRLKEGDLKISLYKFGANFNVGYQLLLGNKVYLDFYVGSGIRLSMDNRNSGFHPWYNDWWGDYGYSGTLLDAGIRAGFFF